MVISQYISKNEDETVMLGQSFSDSLHAGDVVALYGDLGSGKTRFAKGISKGLRVHEQVTSPTFVILNEHYGGKIPMYHFDFYRMRSLQELDEIGFDEYVYGSGVCIIEWADMVEQRLPEERFNIYFEQGTGETERMIRIERGPSQ
jgi:tRNA threonylcarbamoyladenosine biosynthesis protein TsaE